jgi:aryl-alcohol dehydrogenase-like predicted oxidoreductase
MEYRQLGKTGLEVSAMGLGTGGPSQLGQRSGVPEAGVVRLVRRALELGINFFDSSAAYGRSEELLGVALRDVPREDYILATKFVPVREGEMLRPEGVVASVERSLRRLCVDAIDILQFHGVRPDDYRRVVDSLLPAVQKMQEQGKFRFLGISETYAQDPRHAMLPMAVAEGVFDTVMVGYSMLSPGVEEALPACREKGLGVICMVAVRRSLSRAAHLLERLADAGRRGLIDRTALPERDPLGWLVRGPVESLPAAGYKYVAAHPAISSVLTGTARVEHLEANVRAVLGPPLPEEDMARLRRIFGEVQEPLGD